MRAKITYLVTALVLVVYFVLVGSRGVLLIRHGTPLTVVFGVAVLVLPVIGVWFLWKNTQFVQRANRLAAELEAEGGLPVDELVRTPSGRVDRASADAVFARRRAETEDHPDDWRCWFRLAVAYHDARDTPGPVRRCSAPSPCTPAARSPNRAEHTRRAPEERSSGALRLLSSAACGGRVLVRPDLHGVGGAVERLRAGEEVRVVVGEQDGRLGGALPDDQFQGLPLHRAGSASHFTGRCAVRTARTRFQGVVRVRKKRTWRRPVALTQTPMRSRRRAEATTASPRAPVTAAPDIPRRPR